MSSRLRNSESNGTESIAVATLWDEEYAEIAPLIERNRRAYCARHGYDFLLETRSLDPTRAASWSKILHVSRNLNSYDWLLWVDADALIMNLDRPVTELLDPEFDLVIGRHPRGDLQAGVFLVRNTSWASDFLSEVYAQDHLADHDDWDQAAINHLYGSNPDHRARIKALPVDALQSVPPDIAEHVRSHRMGREYREGDFVLHFYRPSDKVKGVKAYADRVLESSA